MRFSRRSFLLGALAAGFSWRGFGVGAARGAGMPLAFPRDGKGAGESIFRDGTTAVWGTPFEGELTSLPARVAAGQVLVFTPAFQADDHRRALTLEAVPTDGDAVTLAQWTARPRRSFLEDHVIARCDLSGVAGKEVAFRFHLMAPGGPAAGCIGDARLVTPGASASLPPVFLYCSDTHRYDYSLGERGRAMMPRFAAFCDEGVVFDRAFANATWTIPSTTTVLTGLAPYAHGSGWRVEVNEDLLEREGAAGAAGTGKATEKRNYSIRKHQWAQATLAETLRAAGYYTLCFTENSWLRFSEVAEDGFTLTVHPKTFEQAGAGAYTLPDYVAKALANTPRGMPLFIYAHSDHVHDYINEPALRDVLRNDRANLAREDAVPPYERRVREFDTCFEAFLGHLKDAGLYDDSTPTTGRCSWTVTPRGDTAAACGRARSTCRSW